VIDLENLQKKKKAQVEKGKPDSIVV